MELAYKAAAICVVAALTGAFLKRGTPEIALLLALATAVAVLGWSLEGLETVSAALERFLDQAGLERRLFLPLVKIVGISLVARLGADLCRDAGQGMLASLGELCGTLCALAAAMPLLTEAAGLFGGWMTG